jgi:hypothetical protein
MSNFSPPKESFMRPIIIVVALLLSTVSCKKEKAPSGILTKAQMVDWMMNIYLAEARVQLIPGSRDSAYKIFVPYQDSLMRRKGVQDSVLNRSYQYYLDRPAEMESIYDAIIDSLSLREQRLRQTPVINP